MSILDCIHNKKDDIYYVLDMMYWKSQDMTDCDVSLYRLSPLFSYSNIIRLNCASSICHDLTPFSGKLPDGLFTEILNGPFV